MRGMGQAVRHGIDRGLRSSLRSLMQVQELVFSLLPAAAMLVFLYFQRHSTMSGVPLAQAVLPGMVALQALVTSYFGVVAIIAIEREDGTVLRMQTLPRGMVSYLASLITSICFTTVCGLLLLLPAFLFVDGLQPDFLKLAALCLLAVLMSTGWGAFMAMVLRPGNSSVGLAMLPMFALVGISGLIYPLMALPRWVQELAQWTPPYWLGLAMREALLPDSAAAIEVDGSWRLVPAYTVVVVTVAVGMGVALLVLNRMARQVRGTAVPEEVTEDVEAAVG